MKDQPFQISAGEEAEIRIVVKDAAGALVDLTGYQIHWVLATARTGVALVEKTTTDGITIPAQVAPDKGALVVALAEADTKDLDGIFYHECRVLEPRNLVLCSGQVTVQGSLIS